MSPAVFTVVFTVNALGLTAASLVFRGLVGRVGALVLARVGAVISAVAATALTSVAAVGAPALAWVTPLLWVAVAVTGLSVPAITVLLQQAGRDAPGSAGALQGASNYAVGAAAAPVLAAIGGSTLVSLSAVLATAAGAQLLIAASADRTTGPM